MITHRWLLAITLGALALGAGACHRTTNTAATADNAMASDNTMGAENTGMSATNSTAGNDASASGAPSQ